MRNAAYVPWKTPAQWMRGSDPGDAPRTLIEEFAKIKSGDVVLKARRPDGRDHALRVRSVATPDQPQKVLLNRLGLTLPQRLRSFDEVAPRSSRLLTQTSPGDVATADSRSKRV